MSDELFPGTHSTPPRLTTARQRLAKAEESDERHDGFSFIPDEIKRELQDARRELAEAEAAEYHSRSGR